MTGPTEGVDPSETRPERRDETDTASDRALLELRERITEIDRDIVLLLADRVDLARLARARKRELGIDVYDPVREAAVVRRAATHAVQAGLEPEPVRELFWRIIRIARDAQSRAPR